MPDGLTLTADRTEAIPEGLSVITLGQDAITARVAPQNTDPDKRTVDLVWTTGARVSRRDMFGEAFEEQLIVSADAIRMDRLNGGAPLLADHRMYSLTGQIGVVEQAWIDEERGEGYARVRFSPRADVDPLWEDVQAGIIRNVSVGYYIHRVEIEERSGGVPIFRVVDWEPMEISLVPVGADAAAGVRSNDTQVACQVKRLRAAHNEEQDMPIDNLDEAPATAATALTPEALPSGGGQENTRQAVQAALAEERQRCADIRSAVRTAGLGNDVADRLVDEGVTADAARAQIFEEMAASQDQTNTASARMSVRGGASGDDPEVRRGRIAQALASRYSPSIQVDEAAREFVGMRVVDIARDILQARGVSYTGMQTPEVIGRAMHSTSDFPQLLADVANKLLMPRYMEQTPTYAALSWRQDFPDFKPQSYVTVGDFPNLDKKVETGEFQYGTIGEKGEKVVLATYGRIVSLSREALINDDLGGFANLIGLAGARVAHFENDHWYNVMRSASGAGPTLDDGIALFAAGHNNLADSAGAIDVDSISDGRAAMRKQRSIDDVKLNIAPRYLLVGPDNETEAEKLTTSIQPQQVGQVNPFSGRLQTVADANIDDASWYLWAEPSMAPVMTHGYLQGQAGPRIATREFWSSEGVEIKVALDFAAGAIDFRGAYRNPGE